MLKLKNWHYLNYKSYLYLCVQQKTNAYLDIYGRIWKFQVSQSCNMLRLIHMYPATDMNTTSDQWSCLHKNKIFLVIILILKHALFRLMQKYLIPVINCLLCCMNWCSWGVIRKSHRISICSHRIRMVVKFYNHTLRLRCGCVPMRYYHPLVFF